MPFDLSRFHESYFDEVAEHLATIERIALEIDAGAQPDRETLDDLFRAAHSIKGASGIFGFAEMAERTHALEALLDDLRDGKISITPDTVASILASHDELKAMLGAYRSGTTLVADETASVDTFGFFDEPTPVVEVNAIAPVKAASRAESAEGTSIRVDIRKVDQLIDLVGEMLIAQSALEASLGELDDLRHRDLIAASERLARYTREIREAVMAVRMLPIGSLFARFHRVVRETARELGKNVVLRTTGDETELDKGLLERIVDPLTHLVRNAIDHGIEAPQRRTDAGKNEHGTIDLRAYERGGSVFIEVRDDGAGIDRERVIARARALGMTLPDAPSDSEVFDCLFAPGFSTAAHVTELSGRGVGMDVVRRNLRESGGHVDIESVPEAGTTFRLRLPLTLAILDGLSVRVAEQPLVLPLASVWETVVISRESVHHANGLAFIAYRDGTLPLIYLAEQQRTDEQHIVLVVASDRIRAGVVVDEIEGQHQIVIKSLETNFRRVNGYSGATVMGNGEVALILDVNALLTSGSYASVDALPA